MRIAKTFQFCAITLGSAFSMVSCAKELPSPRVHQGTSEISPSPNSALDSDGTTNFPPLALPYSTFVSQEAKKTILSLGSHPYPEPTGPVDVPGPAVDKWRRDFDREYFLPILQRFKAVYPVNVEARTIAGLYTDVVTPIDGILPKNKNRVLINLHGGGFVIGARVNGQIESVPIAHVGRIKVVSVDYRLGPENRFPAASEDVAAVYRELLKDYPAENIGIFGCSAGGLLAAQAVAWFQKEQLPRPGAIAILCASAGRLNEGDSTYLWSSQAERSERVGYLQGVDPHDPLVSPVDSPAVLGKFPPTLVMTSTRAADLSAAVYTDIQLTRLGVASELHVWDGLGHGGFINNADVPETKDAVAFVVRFFDRYLQQ